MWLRVLSEYALGEGEPHTPPQQVRAPLSTTGWAEELGGLDSFNSHPERPNGFVHW